MAEQKFRLIEQVKESPVDWADNIMEEYPFASEAEAEQYVKSHYWCGCDSINVHDVVGTAHPDYSGKSWLNLLLNGKRMQNVNLPLLEQNPSYYYEDKKKDPIMEYKRVDNKTYICIEGNHRTCIARFLFHYEGRSILHGVSVDQLTIDHEFKTAHERLNELIEQQKIIGNTKIVKLRLKRDDTAGWMREEYDLKLEVRNRDCNLLLTTGEIYDFILDSQRPFRKLFGKFKKFWRQ